MKSSVLATLFVMCMLVAYIVNSMHQVITANQSYDYTALLATVAAQVLVEGNPTISMGVQDQQTAVPDYASAQQATPAIPEADAVNVIIAGDFANVVSDSDLLAYNTVEVNNEDSATKSTSTIVNTPAPSSVEPSEFTEDLTEARSAWNYLNAVRTKLNLPLLDWDETLAQDCERHAYALHKSRRLYHSSPSSRAIQDSRECCAVNPDPTHTNIIHRWLASYEGHRETILARSATHVGLARSGNHWSLLTHSREGAPTAKPAYELDIKTRERLLGSYSTVEISDGITNVKTYSRTGRARPIRYALWRTFK
jgi:uncharacterized protein YkwD